MTSVPQHNQPAVDADGRLTRAWMGWVQAISRVSGLTSADDIAAIATALGSPDGTVANIPPQAVDDPLIVGLVGIITDGRLSSGRVTVSLSELEDTGVGAALLKTTRDAYGRTEGTEAATTDDLAEGSSLYYTQARADARVTAGIQAFQDAPTLTVANLANAANDAAAATAGVAVGALYRNGSVLMIRVA